MALKSGENPLESFPVLQTPRLVLRELDLMDAPEVQRLAGDYAVAATTLNIPHPYLDGVAENWILGVQSRYESGEQVAFAITRLEDKIFMGSIGLVINQEFNHAEMGYWIGKPYWGQGYTTEAGQAVLGYGFKQLELHRILARHMRRNPASGKVMQKIGMVYEGCMRQHIKKWDKYEDVMIYASLKSEYDALQKSGRV